MNFMIAILAIFLALFAYPIKAQDGLSLDQVIDEVFTKEPQKANDDKNVVITK